MVSWAAEGVIGGLPENPYVPTLAGSDQSGMFHVPAFFSLLTNLGIRMKKLSDFEIFLLTFYKTRFIIVSENEIFDSEIHTKNVNGGN